MELSALLNRVLFFVFSVSSAEKTKGDPRGLVPLAWAEDEVFRGGAP